VLRGGLRCRLVLSAADLDAGLKGGSVLVWVHLRPALVAADLKSPPLGDPAGFDGAVAKYFVDNATIDIVIVASSSSSSGFGSGTSGNWFSMSARQARQFGGLPFSPSHKQQQSMP
jgi:hypothetical protein